MGCVLSCPRTLGVLRRTRAPAHELRVSPRATQALRNPRHVQPRAGRRKMRGVKGRKQLVRSTEDINLRGRQDGRRGCLIKHGITAAKVCVSVCQSSWRITGELEGVLSVRVYPATTNLMPLILKDLIRNQRSCCFESLYSCDQLMNRGTFPVLPAQK